MMRCLLLLVVLVALMAAINWPHEKVQCHAASATLEIVSGAKEPVLRGQTWRVVVQPPPSEEATVWIYDEADGREIAKFSLRALVGDDVVVLVPIDQRFDGVNHCWMWIHGR